MVKIMEILFGAPEDAKANITVGKLQEIVTMYNDLLRDYNTLKEENNDSKERLDRQSNC